MSELTSEDLNNIAKEICEERDRYKEERDHQYARVRELEDRCWHWRLMFWISLALTALMMVVSIWDVLRCVESREDLVSVQAAHQEEKDELAACSERNKVLGLSLIGADERVCPVCPGCLPPPGCTESGQLEQCSGRLAECEHQLNYRKQKVEFGEWLATMQAKADDKIAGLRTRYFALLEEFQPLVAKATEMGLGLRARDWINKPGAVELYLELGDRWAELDLLHFQMKQVIQEADSIAQRTCYQNIVWSWGDILPDERDHDRLQQEAYRLTDGKYLVYLYELQRRARNEEQP